MATIERERPASATRSDVRGVVVFGFMLVAGLLYNAWILGPWLDPGLGVADSYASELAADGRPYAVFFRSTDAVVGVLAFVAGMLVLPVAGSRRARYAAWSVVGFGMATVLDVVMPLSCSPTQDAACAEAEREFRVPMSHLVHSVASGAAGICAVVALVAVALSLRSGCPRWTRNVAAVCGAAGVATSTWTVLSMVHVSVVTLGVAQRAQVVVIGIGLGLFGYAVWRWLGDGAWRRR